MRAAELMRIRQAATGTAMGAALLLFFGFGCLARPSGTDLFSRAWLAVYFALRIGGLATAAIAVWLWSGRRVALIVDAAVAVTLGAILALSGLAMLFDGGNILQSAIITLCGGTFISSGLGNGRDYMQRIAAGPGPVPGVPACDTQSEAPEGRGSPDGDASLAERMLNRSAAGEPPDYHSHRPPKTLASTGTAGEPAAESLSPQMPAEPPPEGFLASFAGKKTLP